MLAMLHTLTILSARLANNPTNVFIVVMLMNLLHQIPCDNSAPHPDPKRSIRKFGTVGGSRVLECDVNYPGAVFVRHIITWRKQGLEAPIFTLFGGLNPHMDSSYQGRIRHLGQASIELTDIRVSDEGWYECSILFLDSSDDIDLNGTWIYLAVNAAPVLGNVSPSLFVRKDGDTVDMYCEAVGSPIPTLIWYRDGKELENDDRTTVSGNHLRIRTVSKKDAGKYSCVFKNTAGTVSHDMKLVIQGNAYIMIPPRNTSAAEGSRVNLQCQAEGYLENITYRWYRDAVDIQLISALTLRSQVLSDGTLVINNVAKEDSGWYLCRPTNQLGTPPEARAYLNVTYPPKVLSMPSRLYLPLGMMGRIDCLAEANPHLTMTLWHKDDRPIDSLHLKHVKVNREGTLILKPVIASDAGRYTCTPYSPLGNGRKSSPVEVLVKDPPYFNVRPKPLYQRQPTQSVTLPCRAEGDPKPVISWRKAEGSLPSPAKILHGDGNLTIVNLGKDDHGVYECVAANVVSSIVTTTLLIIELTTPHPPYNITVDTSRYSAFVHWMPAYDGGFIQHYVVWYRPRTLQGVEWNTLRVLSKDLTSLTIHQLHPDTVYDFMVLSRNRQGDGWFSDVVHARTKTFGRDRDTMFPSNIQAITSPEDRESASVDVCTFKYLEVAEEYSPRPPQPINVTVSQHKSGLLISWAVPESSYPQPDYFRIQYKTVGQWVLLKDQIKNQYSYNWTTASRKAKYHFRVYSHMERKEPEFDDDLTDEYYFYDDKGNEVTDALKDYESIPSAEVVVETGDPMDPKTKKISESTMGLVIGSMLVLLVGSLVFFVVLKFIKNCKCRQKEAECHMAQMLATTDPDPVPYIENHISDGEYNCTNKAIVKETPI